LRFHLAACIVRVAHRAVLQSHLTASPICSPTAILCSETVKFRDELLIKITKYLVVVVNKYRDTVTASRGGAMDFHNGSEAA